MAEDEARLPAGLEAASLIRRAQSLGGNACVLHKGDPDAGTILVILLDKQGLGSLHERLPQPDGPRKWVQTLVQTPENKEQFDESIRRRADRDRDLWIIELMVADGERSVLNAS